MMICPKCRGLMKHVYRFTPEKSCELDVCNNCYFKTKPKKIDYHGFKIIQENTDNAGIKKSKKKIKKSKKKGRKR